MDFINPAPAGLARDFRDNPIFEVGTTVNVAWTAGSSPKGWSLVLYQLNQTTADPIGGFELLTPTAQNVRYTWLVGSSKALSISNLFFFSLFQYGNYTSDANSHYFNITNKAITPTSTSSTSLSSATSRPPSTLSSITTSTPNSTSTPSSLPPTSQSSSLSPNTFPTTAKVSVGVGIGIGAALLLSILVGLLLFRRRDKKPTSPPPYHSNAPQQQQRGGYGLYGPDMHEVPNWEPAELDACRMQSRIFGGAQHGVGVSVRSEPVRYEM